MDHLKLYLASNTLILLCQYGHIQGAVTISPSKTAQVCIGDQLELTCTITGRFLGWSFPLITNKMTRPRPFTRGITAEGPTDTQAFELMDNSTTYTILRSSAEGNPVMSRLTISAVSDDHNGTVVTCTEVATSESSSTTIVITDSQIQDPMEVNTISEQFEGHTATITLDWSQGNPFYSYYVDVIPPIPLMFNGSTSATVKMSFNTQYNLSILAEHQICGENNKTIFNELYNYSYCRDPSHQIDDTVRVLGYMDSAIVGSSITFSCSLPGYSIVGSNTSFCTKNGQWEPDPRETTRCKAKCGPPSPPPNCHLISYTSTIEGAEATFVCWSAFQVGHHSICTEDNITAICNKEGNWEPLSYGRCAEQSGSSLSHDGVIAVASSISVFVVTSSLFFIVGYLCGRKQGQNSPSSIKKPAPAYEDVIPKDHEPKLKLKTNIAYAPVKQLQQ